MLSMCEREYLAKHKWTGPDEHLGPQGCAVV